MSRQLKKVKHPKKGKGGRRKVADFSLGETASYLEDMWGLARAGWSLFNTEVKMFDANQPSFTFDSAGNMQYLSGIAQGVDYNQRTGNSVKVIGLEFNLITTIIAAGQSLRSVLFSDRESRGVVPAATDLLEAGGGVSGVISPYEHKSVNRFQIIKDDQMIWGTGNNASSVTRAIRVLIPMQHHVAWNGTTGAQADSGEQSLYLYLQSDSVTAGSGGAQFWVRTFYVDN
jgi:hypothetical protein